MAKLTIKNRYGTVPNELLNRADISMKAKGLFAFMQSKPDGWSFSVERISNQTLEGKEAIQSGLKELEDAGYLRRTPSKQEDGTWDGYDYYLTDEPLTGNPPTVDALTEKPVTISKKEYSKQDIVNKTKTSEATASRVKHDVLGTEIIKAFESVDPKNKGYYGNTTQRTACDFLIAEYGLDEVLKRISYLPRTNTAPFFPRIYTPLQLKDKWKALEDAAKSKRSETISKKPIVLV